MELVKKITELIAEIKLPKEIPEEFMQWYLFITRYILALLALIIVIRCAKSLLSGKDENEVWGYLALPNGAKIRLNHWENIIGRASSSDVMLEYPTLSRTHAAIMRGSNGKWSVCDLGSKAGVLLNGNTVSEPCDITDGDVLTLGGVETVFMDITLSEERASAENRTKPGKIRPGFTLFLLTLFITIVGVQLIFSADTFEMLVPAAFGGLIVLMWLSFFLTRAMGRYGFELETLAFFLTAVGFTVAGGASPESMLKNLICLTGGIVIYWVMGFFIRDLKRAKNIRWVMGAVGLCLLLLNVLTAKSIFGAKNWISIGSISFQPSEFVKICFIFAGAASMDRLFARRNIIMFVLFSGACVGCLALMSDFGTAAVFFAAYIVIAFLRSGSFSTILLSVSGAGFAGFLALTLKPYIAARFATWGHAWEYANESGYQQVRTMASAASGGLFGLGAGKGWLNNVFAADTDMVFGLVCEELGLVIGLLTIATIFIMAFFTVKSSKTARSSYYVIAACGAITMYMCQLILNVFGSVDILPFTGVTFPFVSNGGSSLMACWGMLAFIKASDTRQNASFAIKLPRRLSRKEKRAIAEREKLARRQDGEADL